MTTPCFNCSSLRRPMALYAPRNLNAPTRCKFSHLAKTCAPSALVQRARGSNRRAAGHAR
ncbi:MAG: hypothetical protein MZV63_28785 [Marinilabiliales bacterium]|nr:hypothetical protein [Marinilabiliales bacterium]